MLAITNKVMITQAMKAIVNGFLFGISSSKFMFFEPFLGKSSETQIQQWQIWGVKYRNGFWDRTFAEMAKLR